METTLNGIQLFYEKSGQGPALVLLHGNGEDHHIFDTLSEKLNKHFCLYALDSRNHGESANSDDFSYSAMAEDLVAFIDELALTPAQVLGFSDGAIIALMAALRHPKQIKRMALLGVNLSPKNFTKESLDYLQAEYKKTKDPLFKLMLEEPNIELSELEKLNTPTLVIAAENDIFKPETFSDIVKTLPHASYLLMEDHDHDSYITDNDVLYPDLFAFFNKA